MFNIILFEPEIPPNTGNIIRLAANTGCQLHLIEPLGFDLAEKNLHRAGLDYHDLATIKVHPDLASCFSSLQLSAHNRVFCLTTKGKKSYHEIRYQAQDCLLFGPETRGLPQQVLNLFTSEQQLRIPMQEQSRSLNLANSVAVVVYEAWRQLNFSCE